MAGREGGIERQGHGAAASCLKIPPTGPYAIGSFRAVDGMWTVEVFEADNGTVPFERFAASLSDFKFAALDMAIEHVLADRGLDLAGTQWLRPVGQGLHEFRIRHEADEIARMFGAASPGSGAKREAVLLRVFVHFHGNRIILLLGGFDKGRDPKRQQREIARAQRLLAQFKQRQRRQKRRRG
ncbi:hypothetical protein [Candidatus Poriferisodalis sp.]|uniref:hypothetical protein n=1 Tax=Candidatus Poriferisodalis sp. TaxID=3101277 RepID=UPI003B01724D